MMNSKALNRLSMTMLATVALTGCQVLGKVSGGGWLPGESSGRANFGFNGAQCEAGLIAGNFNYLDKKSGVKMNGEVTSAWKCESTLDSQGECVVCVGEEEDQALLEGCDVYEIQFDYTSTNPRDRGDGEGQACVIDCGEGSNMVGIGDYLAISALSGPFTGYSNANELSGGNVQAQTCTCTDGEDNDGDYVTDADDIDCVDANADEDTYQEPNPT